MQALSTATLSSREARWLAIAAQGLAGPRGHDTARHPGRRRLTGLLARLGAIQLDAVNVLCRTQFLVPFSRLGPYDRDLLIAMTGPGQPWFEYWGHAASLLPSALYPLLRPRMVGFGRDGPGASAHQHRRAAWRRANTAYISAVLAEVADRGPLTASELTDPRRQVGEWWDRRSHGRRALELLFGDGVLAAWRSESFERVYDLAERVIPREALEAPVPGAEEADRELVAVAASALGVATATDLADYFVLPRPAARRRVAELVEAGRLLPVSVEGWAEQAYVPTATRPRAPRREEATLVSPFDSLIWTRGRTERLFGFHYRIEIYVPKAARTHGYYVLPLLLCDRLVARFDLKADRPAGVLLVRAAHAENGEARGSIAEPAAAELAALARWLGLERVSVGRRGDLAPSLRQALAR